MDSPGLQRFVDAQERTYEVALTELKRGRKQSHWMWYIFPQMAGLGRSDMARFYGIRSAAEASAYLAHPILSQRLIACTNAVLLHENCEADAIFGAVDALKFRSSMTLFEAAEPAESAFSAALDLFFRGDRDERTLALLAS